MVTVLMVGAGSVLMLFGAAVLTIGGLGMLRLPDLYLRMAVVTKAATLGVGVLMLAVTILAADLGVLVRSGTVTLFLLITAPVASHAIGRVAYHSGLRPSGRHLIDELDGAYTLSGSALAAHMPPVEPASAASHSSSGIRSGRVAAGRSMQPH